jgi:anti-sigma factor RsiW
MSDRWTEALSDYLDGGLSAEDRRLLAAHLVVCPECASVLEELRLVSTRARSLPVCDPDTDLWPGIEARIRAAAVKRPAVVSPAGGWSARRLSFSLPQLAAACVALAVLSGGAVWFAFSHAPSRVPGSLAGRGDSVTTYAASNAAPDNAALKDIEDLRGILASGREQLDPATVRSLEESLTIIDLAIRQAKRALEADPHNPYVRAHLDETMRRKVDFLRRATILASASE